MTRAMIRLALTVCAVGALVWVLYSPGALTPAMGEPADNGPQLIPAVSIVAPGPQAPVAASPVTAG
jgi:hypothetical protein